MPCRCSQYRPIELDRESIVRRIQESPGIQAGLEQISFNSDYRLYLFRCAECSQFWQSGHEWNFEDRDYLFQVPTINLGDWQQEPFLQPAAMMIYSAVMKDLFARAKFEPGNSQCKIPDCKQFALKTSVFCRAHHIESMQKARRLPKKPLSRMFPPYFIELQ